MPKKVTKDQVDRIVYLRDKMNWPWYRISEDVGLSEKTCQKHYRLRKAEEEERPRGEGELHAEAFHLFDRGGRAGDAVRELKIPVEKAEELYTKYLETGKQDRDLGETGQSLSEEYKIFKKRGVLRRRCQKLLGMLHCQFEEPLTDKRDLVKERISFLQEKVEGAGELNDLKKLEELLELEKEEIKALLDRDRKLYEKRREGEREAKKKWIIQRRMNRGMSKEEAEKSLQRQSQHFERGLEGVYNYERQMERNEKRREECLKYMSEKDYYRLSVLFLSANPSAEYLIRFYRQERDIITRYGEEGWWELNHFYLIQRDNLRKEKPDLEKAFSTHLWRKGLAPCSYCNKLISTIGAPQRIRCPRCGGQLIRKA
ncbi:MAG: hypothetical protein ACE5OW_06780 [Candidatus Bathyarchaeia archaeon]